MRLPIGFLWNTVRPSSSRYWRAIVFLCALTGVSPIHAQTTSGSSQNVAARAEAGDLEAQNTLGNELTNRGEFSEALIWYDRAAARGFAPAQFNLGLVYELGRGVKIDLRQAFRYYLLAAEQGFLPAQFNTGNMYATGRGVGQDLFEANIWFKQAAEQGLAEAQYNLGLAYESGRGIRKDEEQAARWYRAAANQGFVVAQYNLGLMAEDGRGFAKDEEAAVALYRSAADKGFAPAMNNLGLMFASGRGGLPKDPITGYAWLALAVEGGASAQGRDFVERGLTGDARTQAESALKNLRERFQRPATAPIAATGPRTVTPPANAESDRRLREELAQALAANSRFAEVNQSLVNEKALLESDKSALEKWVTSLERASQQRDTSSGQLDALKVEIASLEERLKQSEANAARLAASVLVAREQNITDSNADIRELRDEVVRLRRLAGEANSLRAMNTRLEGELLRLREGAISNAQLEGVSTQLAAAKAAEENAKSEVARLRAELVVTQKGLDLANNQNGDIARELDALQIAVETARAGAAESSNLRARLEELVSANARLTAGAERSAAELATTRAQIEKFETQLAAAQTAAQQAGATASQAEQLQARVDELSTANTRLSSTAAQSEASLATSRQQLTETQNQLGAARHALSNASATAQQTIALQARVDELNSANARLNSGTAELERSLANTRQQIEETQAQLASARLAASGAAAATAKSVELQERIDELSAANARLSVEAERSGSAALALRRQVEQQQSELNNARAAESAARGDSNEASQLRDRISELSAANAGLAKEAERAERDHTATRQQVADIQTQLVAARTAADYANAEAIRAAKLQAQVEELNNANARLSAAAEQSDGALLAARRQMNEFQSQLVASQVSAERARTEATQGENLQARVDELMSANARLAVSAEQSEQALQAARQQIQNFQTQITALGSGQSGAQEQAARHEAQLRATQQSLNESEARAAQLQRETIQLREAVAAAGSAAHDAQELRQQLAALQQQFEASEASVARLTNELSNTRELASNTGSNEVRDLRDEIVRLRRLAGESSSLRAMNIRVESELQRLRASAIPPEQLEDSRNRLAAMQASEQSARQEISRLQAALETAQQIADSSSGKISSQQSELGFLRAELELAQAAAGDNQNLRSRVDELSQTNARLAAAQEAAEQRLTLAEHRLIEYQAQVAVADADRDSVRADALALRDALQAAQQSLKANEGEVAQLRQANADLANASATAAAATRDVADLRGQLTAAQSSLAQVQNDLMAANQALRQRSDELATVRARPVPDTAAAEAKAAEWQQKFDTALRENESFKTRLADLGAENQRLGAEIEVARQNSAQLSDLKTQVANLQEENAKFAAALRDTRALDSARSQIATLERRLAESEATRGRVSADEATVARLKIELDEAKRVAWERLAGLEKQLDEANRVSEAHRAMVQQLTAEKSNLEQDLAAARRDTAPLVSLRAEIVQLQQENNRLLATSRDTRALDAAQSRITTLEQQLAEARTVGTRDMTSSATVARLQNELRDAIRASESLQSQVADLTAAHANLERELANAKQSASSALAAQTQMENLRLTDAARDAKTIDNARAQVANLERQLADARRAGTTDAATSATTTRLQNELRDAVRASENLQTQVAELTSANARLEKDLTNAKKMTDAALAAQSQAMTAASPDAFRMEIRTLEDRTKQLEKALEDDRIATAREISSLAEQLLKARETSNALSDANRALLAVRSADNSPSRVEFDQMQARVRDLTTVGEELRRQNERITAENLRLQNDRDQTRTQLTEAEQAEATHNRTVSELTQANAAAEQERVRLVAQIATLNTQLTETQAARSTASANLAEENRALDTRLRAVGADLLAAQRQIEQLRRDQADAVALSAARQTSLETVQSEMAALRKQIADAGKVTESQGATVAELTGLNTKLSEERDTLRRQLDAANTDAARLALAQRTVSTQLTEAERAAAQTVESYGAQIVQLQREVEGLRQSNQRLADSNASLDRERQVTLAQLRQENSALTSRLTQAQSTLDQIASAARLGTPAAGIASSAQSSNPTAATPSVAASDARIHFVADGDSLSRLSLRYYGTANRWQDIYNANRDVLQGENSLRVGQRLRIP